MVGMTLRLGHLLNSNMKGAEIMTTLLTKAIKQIEKLPANLQDEIAEQLLSDFESEMAWEKTLSKPQPKLELLAERALRESEEGKTKKMGFDEL